MKAKGDFSPFYSNKLIGMDEYLDTLTSLYKSKKFPKVLLLSGKKGSGKFTLVLHFLNFIFSESKYNYNLKSFDENSSFHSKLTNGVNENVFFIKNNENLKIDEIRKLKSNILKTSLSKGPRFFIFDDVEKYSLNTANALLKILEEPSDNNNFVLIDNKESDILETISSRAIKINIFLKKKSKDKIIDFLLRKHNIEDFLDYNNSELSPGLFLEFNNLALKEELNDKKDYLPNLEKLLNLYKKNKDYKFISLSKYFTEVYFYNLALLDLNQSFLNFKKKDKVMNLLNDFVKFNLNQKTVYNNIKLQFTNAK